ncbi:MAG: redoxin domain-containing protein [Acidobacteria bacterium]|nr:redoxin domain-containing protein [Acidobacteriota bacterium]
MRKIVALLLFTVAFAAHAEDLDKMRALFAQNDWEGVLHEPMPTSTEGRALRILALHSAWINGQAKREAAALAQDAPNDPWSFAIQAAELSSTPGKSVEVLALSEKMMAAAPKPIPARLLHQHILALRENSKLDQAAVFIGDDRLEKADLLTSRSSVERKPELVDQAIATLEELRKNDPHDIAGRLRLAGLLGRGRKQWDKALDVNREAAALTPSLRVHNALWDTINAQRNMTAEQKLAAIEADMQTLPADRRDWTETRLFVARQYRKLKLDTKAAEIEDALLRETPDSYAVEQILWARINDADHDGGERMLEEKAAKRKLLQEFVSRPHFDDPMLRASGYQQLFYSFKEDPAAATDRQLLESAKGMEPVGEETLVQSFVDIARVLADRRIELDYAERMARKAIAGAAVAIEEDRRLGGIDPADQAKYEGYTNGNVHDALGWVLLQKGELAAANKELLAAYDLWPDNAGIVYHLGVYQERRGSLARAEEWYRKGALLQSATKNQSQDALKALYKKRNGSLKGYEAYLATLKDKDANARRTKVLGTKVKTPKPAPAFALATLGGYKRSLQDYRGKVAVINFWGVWCGWCVREMPDYQALVKKYKDDPKVAVLTINNDTDLDKVRKWMKDHKYDFDVLLDDGWVGKQSLHSFPTTWFIDPKGRIAFEKRGWSEKLVEEFSWRIDALKQ